tara:strand:+ start:6990 stop:7964 length:975 start_codon:yes stop_codon:yes gene_type:complete
LQDLVSVIVPVYNSERYLQDCINSILEQTYRNIELIIVNDGSTDSSLKILKDFEARDCRVKIIDKENAGVSAARNEGIAAARGMYIGFVDSDDVIKQDLYEKLVKILSDSTAQCAVLSSYTMNENDEGELKKSDIVTSQEAINRLLKLKFPTSLWAYLYKKEVIEYIRLKEDVHFFEDFEFNLRALMRCRSILLCPEKLYNYRKNESSINSQGASAKRLTCLSVSKYVRKELEGERSRERLALIDNLECYFVICVLAPLSTPLSNYEREYAKVVQRHIRGFLPRLCFLMRSSMKYKVFMLLAAVDVGLAVRCREFRKSKVENKL